MSEQSILPPEQTLSTITPEIYQRFLSAIAVGKWSNGIALTQAQKETCLQAIIIYESQHLSAEKRTGYVPPKKTPCDDENPLVWKK